MWFIPLCKDFFLEWGEGRESSIPKCLLEMKKL